MTTTTPADATTPKPAPRKSRRGKVVRAVGITALTLGVVAAGGYMWLDRTGQVHNVGVSDCTQAPTDGTAADSAAVCATLSAMTEAWDRNDATAFGAVFTENATYTTFVGTHYQGRHDLTEAHRTLFGGFLEGTKLADSFLDIRFYGQDVAIVTTRGDTYKKDRPEKLSKIQTYTVVREPDGVWRIASFHNTKRQAVMERISFLFAPGTKPAAEQ